jgi:hypothetical protein
MLDYEKMGAEVGRLVKEKQIAYGDSFGRSWIVLKALYPKGIQPDQYKDLLAIVRCIDKLFRLSSGNKAAFNENPAKDLAGYALLMMGSDDAKEKKITEKE